MPLAVERAHPLARALWNILRDRSVADRAMVLAACERRLGRGDMPEKQEQAFYAVSLFVTEQGHVPHANEWDEWRKVGTTRRGLPSATFIRNAFGSWSALRSLFATTAQVDVLSARLTASGSQFTNEELIRVLQLWAAETDGPLLAAGLELWLASDRPTALGVRVPRSRHTFYGRFGDFAAMLATAGLSDRSPRVARTARDPLKEAQMREVLLTELVRWADSREGVLFRCDFLAHLSQLPESHELHGVAGVSSRLRSILGSWDAALLDAGLIARATSSQPGGVRSTRPAMRPGRRVETNDWQELGVWVRQAAASGPEAALSYPQYDQWRKRRIEASAAAGELPERIPSSAKLRAATEDGSWFTVKVRSSVPGAEEFAAHRPEGRTYSDELIRKAVLAAMHDLRDTLASPGSLRPSQYMRWRANQRAPYRGTGNEPRLPTVELVRQQLGGPEHDWSVVMREVLDVAGEDPTSLELTA